MFRIISTVFAVCAGVRLYFDAQATLFAGRDFAMAPLGQVWAAFDRNSLLGLQPAIERYLHPWVWEQLTRPVLLTPLAVTLALLSVLFLILSAIARARRAA